MRLHVCVTIVSIYRYVLIFRVSGAAARRSPRELGLVRGSVLCVCLASLCQSLACLPSCPALSYKWQLKENYNKFLMLIIHSFGINLPWPCRLRDL